MLEVIPVVTVTVPVPGRDDVADSVHPVEPERDAGHCPGCTYTLTLHVLVAVQLASLNGTVIDDALAAGSETLCAEAPRLRATTPIRARISFIIFPYLVVICPISGGDGTNGIETVVVLDGTLSCPPVSIVVA